MKGPPRGGKGGPPLESEDLCRKKEVKRGHQRRSPQRKKRGALEGGKWGNPQWGKSKREWGNPLVGKSKGRWDNPHESTLNGPPLEKREGHQMVGE